MASYRQLWLRLLIFSISSVLSTLLSAPDCEWLRSTGLRPVSVLRPVCLLFHLHGNLFNISKSAMAAFIGTPCTASLIRLIQSSDSALSALAGLTSAHYLHCQHLCSYLAARYLLQLYCSLATSYCRSFGDLLYFDYICGLHYHNPQRGVNMLASIAFSLSLTAVLVCLCTTAAMQHLLQHFLRDLSFCLRA